MGQEEGGKYKLVGLSEGGVLDMRCVDDDSVQGSVIEDDHAVCFLGKTFESQKGVVGLDDDFACAALVVDGEDTVCLQKFLGVSVVQSF